jgi:Rieske [2Fe-2S] domain
VSTGERCYERQVKVTRSAKSTEESRGSWTEHYPELGTGPISFRDSTSAEFFELEREAVFKRAWLNVGRVEELPRTGSYVTKEIEVARVSVLLVRGRDDRIRAFYNVCRHRGNKLVWNDFPGEETRGTCRQFT